jgi:hypothetical protein
MYVINYLSTIDDIMSVIIVNDNLFSILWILEESEIVLQFKVFSSSGFNMEQKDLGWSCFKKWLDKFDWISKFNYGK